MATLSDEQIALYAIAAGLKNNVPTAVAVALAESGGNPRAYNGNARTGDSSYGLWQINMLGSLGPARRQQFGLKSDKDLLDPATNARVMVALSANGTNWGPWTTYKLGTHKKYMARGEKAFAKAKADLQKAGVEWTKATVQQIGPIIGTAIETQLDVANTVAGAAVEATPWAGAVNAALAGAYRLGINAGVIIIALVLLVLGVVILLRAPLAKAVKAMPMAKAAKAVKA